jgi:hypothetical protein
MLNHSLTSVRALFLVAFSIGFLSAGGLLGTKNLPYLKQWIDAKSWIATPAQVIRVKLPNKQGQTVAEGSYRYDFDGKSYIGSNLGLQYGALRDYHWSVAAQLQEALNQTESISVWVNPKQPSESIVDRQLRFATYLIELLFALFFFSTGGLIAAIGLQRLYFSFRPNATPWLKHPAWQGGPIKPEAGRTLKGLWLLWWIACVTIVPMSGFFLFTDSNDKQAPFVPVLFLALYIGFSLFLLHQSWRVYQNRKIRLWLEPFPGQIGGSVAGRIQLEPHIDPASQLSLELRCLYQTHASGTEKKTRVEHELLWSERGIIRASPGNTGFAVEFSLSVPDHLPSSIVDFSGTGPVWALDLTVRQARNKARHRFWIPVFRVA